MNVWLKGQIKTFNTVKISCDRKLKKGGLNMFSFLPLLAALFYFAIVGIGIYALYLIITALRIYIKKNS